MPCDSQRIMLSNVPSVMLPENMYGYLATNVWEDIKLTRRLLLTSNIKNQSLECDIKQILKAIYF